MQNAIDPDTFKVFKCPLTTRHNFKLCPSFHSASDRRRSQHTFFYRPEPCPNPSCTSDACEFSHNEYEQHFHQEFYKTRPCPFRMCQTPDLCPYLHQPDLKKIEDRVVASERSDLSTKLSALSDLSSSLHSQLSSFKCFNCAICQCSISSVALACGHLSCLACSEAPSCAVCSEPSRPFFSFANK
jgi:hypothetical protein